MLVLVPLLDLVNVMVAAGVEYLATNDFAAKAATQPDFNSALSSLFNEATQFQTNGLAKFVRLQPEGGYIGCGSDLYFISTSTANGTATTSSPNQAFTQQIDTTNNMYELSIKSSYSVPPLISLAALPVLSEVPGLSQPVTFTFTANRPLEQPGGFQPSTSGNNVGNGGSGGSGGSGSGNGSAPSPFARSVPSNPNSFPPQGMTGWNNSAIYQQIAQAGQTAVSSSTLIVYANNPNWTPTNISLASGQKLYTDVRQSMGLCGWWALNSTAMQTYFPFPNMYNGAGWLYQWFYPSPGCTNASGYPTGLMNPGYGIAFPNGWPGSAQGNATNAAFQNFLNTMQFPTLTVCSLDGQAGPTGTPFFVGNGLTNYAAPGSGPLKLMCNGQVGNYATNYGLMYVRVIVAQ
jgi:hypothetical protein